MLSRVAALALLLTLAPFALPPAASSGCDEGALASSTRVDPLRWTMTTLTWTEGACSESVETISYCGHSPVLTLGEPVVHESNPYYAEALPMGLYAYSCYDPWKHRSEHGFTLSQPVPVGCRTVPPVTVLGEDVPLTGETVCLEGVEWTRTEPTPAFGRAQSTGVFVVYVDEAGVGRYKVVDDAAVLTACLDAGEDAAPGVPVGLGTVVVKSSRVRYLNCVGSAS